MTVRPGPSPQITARMLHRLAPPDTGTPCPPSEPLTRREKEVAALIAAGLTNTGIGEELFVSLATVKSHAAHLQRELGVRNRVGIAAWAWQTGLAPTERPWTSRRRRVAADGHRPVRAPPPLGRGQQLPARPLVPGCHRGIGCDDVGHRAGATAPRLLHCSTDRRGTDPTSGHHKPPRTHAGCPPTCPLARLTWRRRARRTAGAGREPARSWCRGWSRREGWTACGGAVKEPRRHVKVVSTCRKGPISGFVESSSRK